MVHQNAKAISVDTSNVLTAGYLSLEAAVSLGDLIICIDRGSFCGYLEVILSFYHHQMHTTADVHNMLPDF